MVIVLLLSSIGITYHVHYCSGYLVSTSILCTPKPCCEHPEECCSDKSVTFQFKNDYVFGTDCTDFSVIVLDIPIVDAIFIETQPESAFAEKIPKEPQPPSVGKRLAELQQFLI